jgi:putative MATE family efflux protein
MTFPDYPMMRDKVYLTSLFTIALPIVLQNFIRSSLNLVAGLMIGQKGDVAVASVGMANQVFFLLMMVLFGITNGCAIFTAQFWGKEDIQNIRRVLGICLVMGAAAGLFFFLVSLFIPQQIIKLFTSDSAVIALGSQFLRIMSPSFLMLGVSFTFSSITRSTGDVQTPLITSFIALSITTLIGYFLIFGQFGLPEMGVPGAAVGINIGRMIEVVLLVGIIYRRKLPCAATFREMFDFDFGYFKKVANRSFPVAINETLWSIGVTIYNVIYARISTESIAAVNIASNIEQFGFVIFVGFSDACGILVGNKIGAGDQKTAIRYAKNTLTLGIVGALGMGVLIFLGSSLILHLYKVSAAVTEFTHRILIVVAATFWVRVSNMIIIVGILRSGGDTRMAFLVDTASVWLVGIPMAYIGAFILGLPVYWVYPMVMTEEFVKFGICLLRFSSRKWINDLTGLVAI